MLTYFVLLYASVLGLNSEEINKIGNNQFCDGFHVDLMDGKVVPNYGFDLSTVAQLIEHNKKIQIHIMAITDNLLIENICKISNIDSIFLHPCWTIDINEAVQIIRMHNIKAGIVWNNDDSYKYFDNADEILCMTVNPGFSGQKMLVDRIPIIQSMHIHQPTWIDGGVNLSNIQNIREINLKGVVAGHGFHELAKSRNL